jgi:hypothetical protein
MVGHTMRVWTVMAHSFSHADACTVHTICWILLGVLALLLLRMSAVCRCFVCSTSRLEPSSTEQVVWYCHAHSVLPLLGGVLPSDKKKGRYSGGGAPTARIPSAHSLSIVVHTITDASPKAGPSTEDEPGSRSPKAADTLTFCNTAAAIDTPSKTTRWN